MRLHFSDPVPHHPECDGHHCLVCGDCILWDPDVGVLATPSHRERLTQRTCGGCRKDFLVEYRSRNRIKPSVYAACHGDDERRTARGK